MICAVPVGRLSEGKESEIQVTFRVTEAGLVSDVTSRISRNADDPGVNWFRDHALIALRNWRLVPAQRAGKPVPAWCGVVFDYRIEK